MIQALLWDLTCIHSESSLRPIYASGWSRRYNFDGVLSHTSYSGEAASSYAQLFRNGSIEACTGRLFINEKKLIASHAFESEIINSTKAYLNLIKFLGVPEPLILFLSLTGVAGFSMALPPSYFSLEAPIQDDVLLAPEVSINSFDHPADQILKPNFDRLWNAAGGQGSIYYDDKGNWIGHK